MRLPTLLLETRRNPRLSLLAAVGAFVLLLLAFQQVVAHAVERGESLRRSASEQALVQWRCRLPAAVPTPDACTAAGRRDVGSPMYALETAPAAPGSAP